MKYLLCVFSLLILFSCSKEVVPDLLFEESFDHVNTIDKYFIPGTGEFQIVFDESVSESSGCLNTIGYCAAMMSTTIGPFETDYRIEIEGWIKSNWGAKFHLVINKPTYSDITIKTSEDYEVMRDWNYFKEGGLELLKGNEMTLYINASNTTWGNSWYDEIKIFGYPK